HNNTFSSTANNHINVTGFHLTEGRIDHKFTFYASNPHFGNRAGKGNVRNMERRRSAYASQHIAVVLAIGRYNRTNNLSIEAIALRKERPQTAVNQSARKHFFVIRTSFPLNKTTRKFTAGCKALA